MLLLDEFGVDEVLNVLLLDELTMSLMCSSLTSSELSRSLLCSSLTSSLMCSFQRQTKKFLSSSSNSFYCSVAAIVHLAALGAPAVPLLQKFRCVSSAVDSIKRYTVKRNYLIFYEVKVILTGQVCKVGRSERWWSHFWILGI